MLDAVMRDPITTGLDRLLQGLQPYVADRLRAARWENADAVMQSMTDSQAVLRFMWDNWNELFRHELSFVERSLVSELREFRNRWAHQEPFSEQDVYRFLDDSERLLTAIRSPNLAGIRELRQQSLKRLYESECSSAETPQPTASWKSMALCLVCAVTIDLAVLTYFFSAVAVVLSVFVLMLFMQIGKRLTAAQSKTIIGPRECHSCGKIVYSAQCPYCSMPDSGVTLVATPETKTP